MKTSGNIKISILGLCLFSLLNSCIQVPQYYSSKVSKVEYPYALGCRKLKRGSVGKDVTKLKLILKSKGYLAKNSNHELKVKERFDKITQDALIAFQNDYSLTPTGTANAITIFYLKYK